MREKTPLLDEFMCFQIGIIDFWLEFWLEVFSWEITSFSKSLLLQRESFLTMFYTINSSPMLFTKSVFKLVFVLSNYQTCTFHLRGNYSVLERIYFTGDEQSIYETLRFVNADGQVISVVISSLAFNLYRTRFESRRGHYIRELGFQSLPDWFGFPS